MKAIDKIEEMVYEREELVDAVVQYEAILNSVISNNAVFVQVNGTRLPEELADEVFLLCQDYYQTKMAELGELEQKLNIIGMML